MRAHSGHNVALGKSVLLQVLLSHFLLGEDFHRKKFFVGFALNQENFTEGSIPKQLVRNEVVAADPVFFAWCFQLLGTTKLKLTQFFR